MEREISIIGSKKHGDSVLSFEKKDKAVFDKRILELSGSFLLTITSISDNANEKQIYHFMKVVVPIFVSEGAKVGQVLSDTEAAIHLLFNVCKLPHGEPEDVLQSLSTEQLSKVIDTSQLWISEFFNIEL